MGKRSTSEYLWYVKSDAESETDKRKLCSMALVNWGNCFAGASNMPDDFGETMVIIGDKLGISPTSENIFEYSKTLTA